MILMETQDYFILCSSSWQTFEGLLGAWGTTIG